MAIYPATYKVTTHAPMDSTLEQDGSGRRYFIVNALSVSEATAKAKKQCPKDHRIASIQRQD